MQEVFEKIRQKLEEKEKEPMYQHTGEDYYVGIISAIEIVDEVEEEYAKVSVEGDLISRSALQEDLRKYEDECESIMMLPSWYGACSVIKKQPIIQNDGWIPCSERLPEEGEEVLCFTRFNDYSVGYLYRYAGWKINYEYFRKYYVIAWQPLPAPYKKEV